MPRRKRPDDQLGDMLRAGWSSAAQLYQHLLRGGEPSPLPPGPVRLERGEVAYASGVIGYLRYYGTSVTYQQSSSLLLGSAGFVVAGMAAESMANASARRRAEAMAASQWRDRANVRVLLTDRRLLCDYGGHWLSFWHEGVMEFHGDLTQWMFVLRFQVGDPLLLHGPPAPWFAVLLAHLLYGPDGLRLPLLAPLTRSIAAGPAALPPGGGATS